MIKSSDLHNQHSNFGLPVSEQNTMYDLLQSAVANGAYDSIPGHLMLAARQNPYMDWNAPLKEVLTKRTIQVGNRNYTSCLIGIPLHGDLGSAFEQVISVKEILREALDARLMSNDDGLIFLDQPLPRSTIQLMTVEDMYHLTPRLFERGVRGSPEPVLDARITETELGLIDSAMMVGLLYWREERAKPRLLTDATAQSMLSEIVKRHVTFDRATPFCPLPWIQSQPMEPLLDATISSSRKIMQRYLDRLFATMAMTPEAATFNVVTSSTPWGAYHIEVLLQANGELHDCAMSLALDELRDGNVSDTLAFLTAQMVARGITSNHTAYQQTNYASTASDAEEIIRSPIALH